MIDEFLQYIQYEKNYSSHTVLSYHTDLIQFCDFLETAPAEFPYSVISSDDIRKWIVYMLSEDVSPRTLSRKMSTLKSYWHFLLVKGYVRNNPTLKIVLPKTKKALPAFFKESEMEMALDDTFGAEDFESVRDRLVLEVFYLTGMRRSELMNLKDNDVDFDARTIRVLGKRNKERIIPISAELCGNIKRYIDIRICEVGMLTEFLFVRKNGCQLYVSLLYNIVHNKMSEVSSLHKRSPHVLRHTFATGMLNGGADINAVKDLLGHSSLAATQVYTHASFDELHNIYNQAHPRVK